MLTRVAERHTRKGAHIVAATATTTTTVKATTTNRPKATQSLPLNEPCKFVITQAKQQLCEQQQQKQHDMNPVFWQHLLQHNMLSCYGHLCRHITCYCTFRCCCCFCCVKWLICFTLYACLNV